MDINQLMIESLQLLALGMGAVFIILVSLIVLITLVSRILPEETPAPATAVKPVTATTNNDHVAAIAAAVQQYRKKR